MIYYLYETFIINKRKNPTKNKLMIKFYLNKFIQITKHISGWLPRISLLPIASNKNLTPSFINLKVFTFLLSFLFLLFTTIPNRLYSQTAVVTTFNANGTWTVPAGVSSIDLEAWGGGAGGGGGKSVTGCFGFCSTPGSGGGGGAGSYTKLTGYGVGVAGTVYAIGVGSGGGGGSNSSPSDGNPGGDSYFNTLATFSAKGGTQGLKGNGGQGNGGAGGVLGAPIAGTTRTVGGNGSNGSGSNGGSGGNSPNGGAGGTSNNAGGNPGGGGGGGSNNKSGGNGSIGLLTVTYYIPATYVIGNNPVAASNICPSTLTVPLHSFTITGANNPGNITTITANLSGTYQTTDITNLKLWTTGTTSTFTSPTQLGATQVSPAGAFPATRTVTFNGLTTNVGNATNYFWVTMDVTGTAALNRTITANITNPANVTATPVPTGSGAASGAQTLGSSLFAPPVPASVAATDTACTSFTANWGASAGATGYFLDVSKGTGGGFNAGILAGYNNLDVHNVLTYDVTGLTNSTTYYYRVRADKCGNTSGNNAEKTLTTVTNPADPSNPTAGAPVCIPPAVTLTRVGVVPGGETYYWQGTNPNGTSTSLGSGATYNATSSGIYYIRSQKTGGCWSVGTGSYSVTVSGVTAGKIASNQALCGGGVPAPFTETVAALGSSITYQWQKSPDNITFTSIVGAKSNTYTAPVIGANTYFRRLDSTTTCGAATDTLFLEMAAVPTITASADVTICVGSTTTLSAAGGLTGYYSWSLGSDLNDSTADSPIATPTATKTYTVTGLLGITEKVVNGNFSAGPNPETGGIGFTSDYAFWPVGHSQKCGGVGSVTSDMCEGYYAIVPNAFRGAGVHSGFVGKDHTTNSGNFPDNFMVVNGAQIAGANIWCETFTNAPNQDYSVSAWVSTMHVGSPASLQFSINGITIGNIFPAPAVTGSWTKFFAVWNSGIETTSKICIVDQTTAATGNDFGIDDISFAPMCAGTDVVKVTVKNPQLSSSTASTICSGSTFTYTATSTSPGPLSYTWTRAAIGGITATGASSGTTSINNTLTNNTGNPINVTYTYTVTSNGCKSTAQNVVVTVQPNYKANFTGMSVGSTTWCTGEVRNVTVTVTNAGCKAWTDVLPNGSAGDINIGATWNGGVYPFRVDAGGLVPGASATYTLGVTAPSAGANNLTFDVVNELNCWFGGNGGLCGPAGTNKADTSVALTVVANAGITLTSAAGTNNQGVCLNTPMTNITYTVSGGASGAGVIGLPAGVAGAFAGVTFTISGTPSVAGVYVYTVTTTGICNQTSVTGTITVGLSLTSAAGTTAQSICINTAITPITYAVGGATSAAATGLPSGVSGAFNAGAKTLTISGTPSVAGSYNYTVTTVGVCAATNLTGNITVGIGLVTPGTDTQMVCKSTPIVNINYNVVGGGTPTVAGLPAGVSGSLAGSVYTISGTPSVEGAFHYTVTTNSSCTTQSKLYGLLTIGMGLTSAIGTDSQDVCRTSPITNIVYAFAGGGTPTIAGLPSGVSGSLTSPGVFTISGSPSIAGGYNYTITTTGSCATQSSLKGTINVGISLMPPTGSDNQFVCKNSAIVNISYLIVGTPGGASVSGLPAGVSGGISSPGVFTISGSPSVEGTWNYTVVTTGPCNPTSSLYGTITVGGGLVSPGGSNVQNVCKNDAIANIMYNIIGGSASVSGLPAGVSGSMTTPGDPGVFTITGSPSIAGIYNYTLTTTGSCISQSTLTGIITVGGGLVAPGGSNTQNVCKNTAINNIRYNIIGGSAIVSGLPSGVTGSMTTPGDPGVFTISGIASVEGIFNYTVNTNGSCGSQSSFTGKITVGGGLDTSGGSNIQNLCKMDAVNPVKYNIIGGSATVSGLPSGVTGSMTTPGDPGVFTISGTATVEGIFNYTVTTNGSCGKQSSFIGKITVGGGLDTSGGSNVQNICKMDAVNPIKYNIIGGSATVSGLPSGVTGSMTTPGDPGVFTISGIASVEGIFNYTVNTNGSCGTQSSFTGKITVGGGLDTSGGSNIQNICRMIAVNPIKYNIIGGSATVSGLPSGVIGSMTTPGDPGVFTISGIASVEGIFNYTVTTNGSCGTQSSFTGIITVGGGLDTTGGSNIQSLCKNTAITNIKYNIIGGSATISGLPGGVTGSMTTPGDPGVFTITGTATVEGKFNYTVTTTGSCATQSSFTGTLTIGLGLVTPGTDTQSVCKSSAITDIVYHMIGAGTPTIIGLPPGVSGVFPIPGDSTVFTIGGTPTAEGTFNYTITTTGNCSSQSSLSGLITVGISNALASNNIQNVCKNTAIADIVYNFVGGGTLIANALPPGVSGTLTSPGVFTISGTPSIEGIYNYTVSTNGSCASQSNFTGIITVGGGLVAGGSNIQNLCKNVAINDILYKIIGDSAIVSGLPSGVTGSMTTSGSPGVFTISGIPSVEGIFNYTVTTNGTCASPSRFTGILTVGGGLDTAGGSNVQNLCKMVAVNPIKYNIIGGSATVSGLPSGVTGSMTTPGDPGVFTISGTASVEGIFNYTVTTNGSCGTQSNFAGIITVGGGLDTAGGSNIQNLCKMIAVNPIKYNIIGGSATVSGLPSGVIGSMTTPGDPGVFTISGIASVEGIFNYTVTTNGSCGTQSNFTGKITVGGGLDTSGGSNIQNLCKNTAINTIKYIIIGDSAIVSGLPSGVTGAMTSSGSPGVFTISGIPSGEGIFNYTVTTNGTCASQSSFTGIITVGGGLDTTGGSNIQDICKKSAITPIKYNIIGSSASVSGLPGGITGIMTTPGSPGVFTISGTATVEGIFNYTVTTNGTCASPSSFTGIITVGGGLDTAGGSNIQDICKNSAITPVKYKIIGSSASVSGLPGGIIGVMTTPGSPGVFTISGTATVEGIFKYTVTTIGSCAVQSSFTGTITVGGGLVVPGGSNIQDICKNSAIAPIKYKIIGSSASVSGLPGGITGIMTTPGSPGIFTIIGTATVEGIFNYTVTTIGSCASQSSFTGIITVGGGLDTTGGSNIQDICKNSAITPIKYKIIGSSANVSGLPGGILGIMTTPGSPGVFTISGTATIEGIFNYTVTTISTCAEQSSFTGTITVGGGLVVPGGSNIQDICKSSAITPIQYKIIGSSATVSGLPGGISGIMTTPGSPGVFTISGTGSVEGIFNYTVTTVGSCASQSSFTGIITVGGGLDTTGGSNIQKICKNQAITPIKYNIVGGSAIISQLPGGITGSMTTPGSPGVFTISGSPDVAGVFNYTVTTTGSCNPQSNFMGTITLDEATIDLTSASETDNQSLCSGVSMSDITYYIGGTGTGATISGLPPGITSNYNINNGVFTISGIPIAIDGVYTITVTTTGGTCTQNSVVDTITLIHPRAQFTNNPVNGNPPLLVNFTNNSQNANTYRWSFGDGNLSSSFDTSNTYMAMGTYIVQLIASNSSQCPDTATSKVIVYKLTVPNVFSPNGDGVNDIFTIDATGVPTIDVEIYNRWGTKIYEWNTTNGGWDGRNIINGLPSEDGTYYYILKAIDVKGIEYNETGFITLIR